MAWSHDGDWFVFEHEDGRSGAFTLVLSRSDGSQRRTLLTNAFAPDWSPDDREIAFTDGQRIGKVRVDSGTVTWLITSGLALFPAWSPDGTRIAFTAVPAGGSGPPDLWTIPSQGGTPVRIPLPAPRGEMDEPSWSPDNTRIVSSMAHAVWRLFRTNVNGTDTLLLTPSTSNATHPVWSPGGNRIAYVKAQAGQIGSIWLINADGTNDRLLVADAFGPSWSPQGDRIAFSRVSSGAVGIWVIDTTGQAEQQVTTGQ